jgi:hypothetical protein
MALTAAELEQISALQRELSDAENDVARAQARREAAFAQVQRWVAYTVAERGVKPSQYAVNLERKRWKR